MILSIRDTMAGRPQNERTGVGMGVYPGRRWERSDHTARRMRARALGGYGMGAFTAVVNGDVQTFADNPCAPGLTFVNGSCFRQAGTQSTPYGEVSAVVAGPATNNAIAQQILGAGTTCKLENVDVGPYAVPQNVCRDARGVVVGGADLIAEHQYVLNQLATVGQSTAVRPATTPAPAQSNPIPQTVRPTGAAAAPAPTNTSPAAAGGTGTNPTTPAASTPIAGATIQTPVGGGAPGTRNPSVVQTATAPGGGFALPAIPGLTVDRSGVTVEGVGSAPWLWIAGGAAALFLLPNLLKGRG